MCGKRRQILWRLTLSFFLPLLNGLPASVKEWDSTATFKSKLQTFMFERAFDLSDQNMNEIYRL